MPARGRAHRPTPSGDPPASDDRALGMHRPIARRDFLNGVALGISGALTAGLAPADAAGAAFAQDAPGYYPPALTGMRGSHPGSFETAHALRDGRERAAPSPPIQTDGPYDLIVVGAGIGGLAAAHFFQARKPDARILILDNHDDFGGHAKRNEFRVGGRLLLANGGTWAIESPFPYSPVARGLLTELGINPPQLERGDDHPEFYRGLRRAVFFDRETFGVDRFVGGLPAADAGVPGGVAPAAWAAFVAKTPLSGAAQADILRIETGTADYYPGLTSNAQKDRLSRLSYRDFLLDVVKAHPDVIAFYQARTYDLFAVGIDAVSALDCWGLGFAGFAGMRLAPGAYHRMGFTAMGAATPDQPPYTFHFPDGNATIARLLVRKLIPGVFTGTGADDIVTARGDYRRLDFPGARTRIRLSSTVIGVEHTGPPAAAKAVDVVYMRGETRYAVRGSAVVMACWNMVIPYLIPDLPAGQQEALHYGVKVPLVYTRVALRNWEPFARLGVSAVDTPGMYHANIELDEPVDIGAYRASRSPREPVVVRMLRTPCSPGLSERDQHRVGRADLLRTPFATFERNIREQLARVLGPGGFDPARDISAITVNRWPHGYAYEYNPLWDPPSFFDGGSTPNQIARQRFGRIAIANSDAAAAAYTDKAIDEAYRAVHELPLEVNRKSMTETAAR